VLRFYLNLYLAGLRSRLEYRADFAVSLLTSLLAQGSAFTLYLAVFKDDASALGAGSASEVLFLFGIVTACVGVSELLFNGIWSLPEYILSGRLDRILVSPANSLLYLLLSKPEIHGLGNVTIGCVMLAVADVGALPIATFVYVVWWVLCAAACYTSVLAILGALSFVLIGPFGDHLQIAVQLQYAARYPLRIYSPWLKLTLLTVLPLGVGTHFPRSWLSGDVSLVAALAVPCATAAVCALVARMLWCWGVTRYESTGS
jgi:ABC-2 type transport system permease protein